MKNVNTARRLDVDVQLEGLSLPQEGDPALDDPRPRRIRPFPLDGFVLRDRQVPGHFCHRAIGVARKRRYKIHERSCVER